eukprot:CAMPEP_0181315256 /NCGR_PEP_ID=MMETSP1101-20121128/15272_1 /TAXON_ID=46948 /ORGANISM="Rhodomonas abbreviata, Strain Caron Lab Isolate" /LENGTH=932 /DNA_ID=CAMNT_0023422439 /DNA_START=99 /DNA_END=2893 /DNA_ORIENTATION=+
MADDQSGPKRARSEEDDSERTQKQLRTEEETKTLMPFAIRTGGGKNGKRVRALTNFYMLRIDKTVNIYQYEVIIKEQGATEFEEDKIGPSKGQKLDVMQAVQKKLGGALAFNAAPTLVSPHMLKDPESGAEVEEINLVVDVPKPNEKRKRNFEVRLRLTKEYNVGEVLDRCQRTGSDTTAMNNLFHLLTSLNVVFHCGPLMNFASRGPWHYTRENLKNVSKVSDLYRAFTQNVKYAESGLVLNFNSGAGVFYKEGYLGELLESMGHGQALHSGDRNGLQRVSKLLAGLKLKVCFPHTSKAGSTSKRMPETAKGLVFHDTGAKAGQPKTAEDITFLKKDGELLQKKLRYVAKNKNGGTRTEEIDFDSVMQSLGELNEKNAYKLCPAEQVQKFFDSLHPKEGKVAIDDILHKICPPTRMIDYFKETYSITLQPNVPILWTGTKKKPSYHYLNHAVVVAGQRKNKADPQETQEMIRFTSEKPRERLQLIDGLFKSEAKFRDDAVVQSFHLQINTEMIAVEGARILPPPEIQTEVKNGRTITAQFRQPGEWDHRGSFFQPIEGLKSWGILVTDRSFTEGMVTQFQTLMRQMCQEKGIDLRPPCVANIANSRNSLEEDLTGFGRMIFENSNLPPQIIVVFKGPDTASVAYSEIKRVCDILLGVPTTCVNSKKSRGEFKLATVKGIVLKINAKLGGYSVGEIGPSVNWRVKLPWKDKTMVFGIDVSHPAPGSRQPSVFAITALMDEWGHRYLSRYKAQSRRVEVGTTDMEEMIEGLLQDFAKITHGPPDSILVYRDGVSDSQFDQVLATEVQAFRNVARKLDTAWKPTITYVISQKRNNTRFFPTNQQDASRNGNFPAGLVVDTEIVNPRMFDFHLLSHSGLQGTSRPVYYHVLLNEGDYTPDAIQELTYALCYGYSRCTKSIGCVTPIYYADKVAER